MDFEVRHIDGTTVKLISSEHKCAITSATQNRKLCGNDTVTINLQSATYIDFYVGDKITIFGTTYTLNQLPTVKKESERSYSYTLVFEGLQYTLIDRVFLMPDNTQGDNLMFDLAGMLDVLDDNINRGNSGKQYEFVLDESLEETEYKNLSLTGKNCLQVLQQLCQEWDTEFVFAEEPTRIAIYIGVAGSTFPTTFKYGRGGGVYELNREKGASDICTRLFVYGGTQNLTYYRHNRLCLPSKEKNQSYVEDATAQAVYGIKEQVKNFDDIYPNRIGTITSLSGCDYNEFIDSAMADAEFGFDLNEKWANNADDCAEWLALKGLEDTPENEAIYYNDVADTATKYLMAGATAKIHFNTGALAGYECDLHSYTHSSQKFVLKPLVDENGYDFPSKTNAAFKLAVGDEYVILDINLPTAYKTQAESKLATEAASYFATVCRPQPKYTLTIEPIALKHIVGPSTADTEIFKVGDLINISDPTGGVESATIRIDQFVRNLLDPFDYKLTLTDEITYSQQVRTLIEVDAIKRVVEESKIYDVNRIRRGWKDAEELYNQMFDTEGHYYSEKIAPLSIDTQMLKVGARSQQLVLQNVLFQPNYNANPANLQISTGSLVHYTIAEPDIKTWTMSALSASNVPSTAQYVYAKCARNGTTGTWLVTDQAIIFDSDPSYYHFLVGSLSSVDSVSNTRNFAATYGFTTINGRNITTGVIKSSDGSSVVIDLDAGIIKGNITFESGTTSYDALQSIIGNNSTVQNAATTANTANATANRAEGKIDGLEIGGRNMFVNTQKRHFSLYGSPTVTFTDNVTVSEWNTTEGIRAAGTKGTNYIYGTYQQSVHWGAKQYVVSIYIKNLGQTRVAITQNGNSTKRCVWEVGEEGRKFFVVGENSTAYNMGFNFIDPDNVSGYAFDFVYWHPKVEEGNVPTDWTPAPEDVNAEIAAEAAAQTAALTNLAASVASDIESLQDQIDGKVETWFGDSEPTLNNEPARTWIAEGKESDHLGDMYYDNITGYAYRFANTGTSASPIYAWLDVSDSAVVEALSLAREAKTAADGKMQVFVAQPVPPYQQGDMWVQGENGDIKYCTTARASGAFVASDWVIASKYTDDTTALAAQSAADAAQTTANNAETHAQSALADLTNYASDAKISPTEKQALVQQLSDINAEYAEIVKQATLYSLLTNSKYTEYVTAYTNAKASLEYYTDTTTWANHITIITGNVQYSYEYIETYYGKRQAILDKIAETAQDYADNAALTAVGNLQIGGRNVLKDSSNIGSSWGKMNATVTDGVATLAKTTTETSIYQQPSYGYWQWQPNTTYAVSVEAKATTEGVILQFQCYGGGTVTYISGVNATLTTEWQRFVCVFQTSDSVTGGSMTFRVVDNNATIMLRLPKLEKGNKATDWTPAPEDTEAELVAMQADLKLQIDRKIETWSQSADPSTNWTAAEKTTHTGDLWQYTGTTTQTRTHNATYRWSGSAWVEQRASSELFDKIDGKAAIWYGSTSDHPAQGETVNNGDFLVDGATGKTYKYAPTQTPNENGWVNVQDYQTPIATLDLRLDNIDDDDVFSISEKQNYRIDFEKITGVHATTIPEAATMIANPSTYANGSFMQHYSKISETAENTLNALKTAYANLRTFLNTVGLYTNSDYDNFSRTNMATYVAAYLNAEAAIDLYAESVSELTATSDTAEGTAAKALTITKPAGVTDSMLQDMLADTAMRLHVKFTNRNASKGVGFGLPVTPTDVSSATARFSYGGATASQECYWPANMEVDLRLLDKTTSYVTYVAVDESNLRQFVMFSNAMEADGGVYGGLALLSLILLRNKAGQQVAGLNGLEDSSLAFWAGGALEDALKDNVPVWIKRDGNAKFGNLAIQKGGTIQFNSNGVRRFEIRNGSASVQTGYVTYNSGNETNNPPVWSSGTDLTQTTITGTESSPQTHTAFAIQDLGHDALQTFQDVEVVISAEISMVCTTLGTGGYATARLEIYSEGEWQAVPDSQFTHSFDSTGQWVEHTQTEFVALYTSQTLTQQVNTSKIGLRVVFYKDSAAGTVAVEVSNIKWHYFQDTSKAKTVVGTNGMIAYVNSNNLFRAASLDNDQSLTTTIKGNTDIPGVLWAGEVSSSAVATPHYKNAAKYASNQLECANWDTDYKRFKITHRLGTAEFTAMVTPSSSAVTARISKTDTYLYVYLSAQASFDLVLFGTN